MERAVGPASLFTRWDDVQWQAPVLNTPDECFCPSQPPHLLFLQLGDLLGSGQFSQVYHGTHKANGTEVAIKRVSCQRESCAPIFAIPAHQQLEAFLQC